MNPFDTAGAGWSESWGRSGQAFLDAQRRLFEALATGMPQGAPPPPPMPDLQGFQAAQAAFRQAWGDAQAMSAAFVETLAKQEEGASDPAAARIMAKVFDPREWLTATTQADEAVARSSDGMAFADLWNVQRRYADLAAAWLALRCRNLEHDTLMMEAWSKAGQRYTDALAARGEAGTAPDSARAHAALWVEIADDALRETQRSEAFLEGQRETLKASTDLRLAQQAIGEVVARMFGQPTRTELDDVHRSVADLRREVRALSRRARGEAGQGGGVEAESSIGHRKPNPPEPESLAETRNPTLRHAEERSKSASRSTRDRCASSETPASRAPQDDAAGSFEAGSEEPP